MNLFKFFDHIGIIVFTFLVIDALVDIKNGEKNWRTHVRLLIGIGGLLVDTYLVFFY